VDQTLLELLQRDGRMSAQALSEAVNLSARATLNRIHKLEDDGHIEGHRALLARQSIGEHVSVFAEIALKDQRQATVQRFEQAMVACPEVIACYSANWSLRLPGALGLPGSGALPGPDQHVD